VKLKIPGISFWWNIALDIELHATCLVMRHACSSLGGGRTMPLVHEVTSSGYAATPQFAPFWHGVESRSCRALSSGTQLDAFETQGFR
jgi:hypothetical protein